MKRLLIFLAALTFAVPAFSQQQVSDKDLATAVWVIGQTMPEGFTLDLSTMTYPKDGLYVSYKETQNSFDRKSLPAVIKHAHAHENIVGGWRDPDTGLYYFDSNRKFAEDQLAAAVEFARENGQHTVYDAKLDINVKSNYEQEDIRVILDCDMGSSTDDLFALMMLYRYMDMKRCTLLGVIVDRMDRANADAVDVMNNYYGYPDIPIGLEKAGVEAPHVYIPYHNMAYARSVDAEPLFKRSIGDDGEYMDGYKLYRKILAQQPDKSVTIASIGFVTSSPACSSPVRTSIPRSAAWSSCSARSRTSIAWAACSAIPSSTTTTSRRPSTSPSSSSNCGRRTSTSSSRPVRSAIRCTTAPRRSSRT